MRTILALACLVAIQAQAQMGFKDRTLMAVVPQGLYVYYNMDETAGIILYDQSGNGRNSTNVNNPTSVTGAAGVMGAALNFVAASTMYSDAWVPTGASNALTVCLWVKNLWAGTTKGTLELRSTNSAQLFCIYNSIEAGGYIVGRAGYSGYSKKPNITIDNMVWNHIAVTVPENSNAMKMYMNGVDRTTAYASSLSPWTPDGHLHIGRGYNTSLYPNCHIDEVRVYERELSATEIADIAAAGH